MSTETRGNGGQTEGVELIAAFFAPRVDSLRDSDREDRPGMQATHTWRLRLSSVAPWLRAKTVSPWAPSLEIENVIRLSVFV